MYTVKQWQYKVIEWPDSATIGEIQLERLGEQRWELVSHIVSPTGSQKYTFKRDIYVTPDWYEKRWWMRMWNRIRLWIAK